MNNILLFLLSFTYTLRLNKVKKKKIIKKNIEKFEHRVKCHKFHTNRSRTNLPNSKFR